MDFKQSKTLSKHLRNQNARRQLSRNFSSLYLMPFYISSRNLGCLLTTRRYWNSKGGCYCKNQEESSDQTSINANLNRKSQASQCHINVQQYPFFPIAPFIGLFLLKIPFQKRSQKETRRASFVITERVRSLLALEPVVMCGLLMMYIKGVKR